ncbi:MAG: phage integrase N-terminal SAM-like domain-containing protein, partial [Treponema sp.]|nr:phage integrase N-terminal SAM-like domain-containing protein [Treponema sp.]
MDIMYLFYEGDKIRIPLLDWDYETEKRLSEFRSGCRDRENHQYILKCRLTTEQYQNVFAGRPFLEVGKEHGDDVIVNGFFGRMPLVPEYRDGTRVAGSRFAVTSAVWNEDANCIVNAVSRPEKLSAAYIDKLETELRSRKYSQKTINMYIHFNKALCKWLQKTPPDMTDQDIKIYMAHLDRDRKFSGSSMNLALSAIRFFYNIVLKRSLGL